MLEVLQHLMRVHDVERAVVVRKRVDVGLVELDIRDACFLGDAASLVQHGGLRVDAYDSPRRDSPREIDRQRSRPAPDVEK